MEAVTRDEVVQLNVPEHNSSKNGEATNGNGKYAEHELEPLKGTDESIPYDPHANRVVPHPTTDTETLIHMLKGSLGTGILAMPSAFKNSGLIVGSVGTLFVGFLCTYCLRLLIGCQYELCKKLRVPILNYPDTMKYALQQGPSGLKFIIPLSAPIVDGFLIVYQLGICCVYIVFMGESVSQIVKVYWPESWLSTRVTILFILIPLILITLIRNLKLLAPFSQAANLITYFGLGVIGYYIFKDFKPITDVPFFGEPLQYTLFIGTTLFALEAVGVVLALENNMKTPKSFGRVLNQGMAIVTVMYAVVGFAGYVRYYNDPKGIQASVTLNLPDGPIAQAVKGLFAVAVFISFALQCYVPLEIIWNSYLKKHFVGKMEDTTSVEYKLRIAVVLLTAVLAVSIPYLGDFISLFGALCLSALGIAFPALIELCILWPNNYGYANYILIKDICIILFGIFAGLLGTIIAIQSIISQINQGV